MPGKEKSAIKLVTEEMKRAKDAIREASATGKDASFKTFDGKTVIVKEDHQSGDSKLVTSEN